MLRRHAGDCRHQSCRAIRTRYLALIQRQPQFRIRHSDRKCAEPGIGSRQAWNPVRQGHCGNRSQHCSRRSCASRLRHSSGQFERQLTSPHVLGSARPNRNGRRRVAGGVLRDGNVAPLKLGCLSGIEFNHGFGGRDVPFVSVALRFRKMPEYRLSLPMSTPWSLTNQLEERR